jgi:putative mRNA 3-end processing factor
VDGDRDPELAVDRNKNSLDGYELFTDPFCQVICSIDLLSADGDEDGKIDHFVDINSDGKPDRYWSPDKIRLTTISYWPDLNNDGTLEYLYDSDGDLAVDHWIDPATRRTGLVIEKDFNDDGNPEFIIDTNGDGRPDKYFDPARGPRGLVTNVEQAPGGNPQQFAIDTTGAGHPTKVYDRVTGEVLNARVPRGLRPLRAGGAHRGRRRRLHGGAAAARTASGQVAVKDGAARGGSAAARRCQTLKPLAPLAGPRPAAMKLKFLGGAGEVGRLGMLLEQQGARVLFDYGLAPSDPPKYPEEAPPVDMAFLSHAHLDHSGMMPWIAGQHGPPAVMTKPTWARGELLAYDSLKVAKAEGYPQPFGKGDIQALGDSLSLGNYRDAIDVGGLHVKLHSAGHIPGSTMFEVRGERRVVFTGDLNTMDSHLVWGAHPVKCDTLVIEGTYAGREHPPRDQVERSFLEACEEVADGGGVALVPAFAVSRTQELMMLLADSGLEVWLDGMGREVTRLMLESPAFLRSASGLERALRNVRVVHSNHGRKLALEGDVILTSSGMLEGGPALSYLDHIRHRSECAVFLTGFQVPGTNGRMLLEEGAVRFQDGKVEKIHCRIGRFDFSAHAGHSDLLEFIKACEPQEVVVFHSDSREKLRDALQDRYRVLLPNTNDEVVLG